VWAVAYVVWLGRHGESGTGAVVETYVWEPTGTRFIGREDQEFAGFSLEGNWLSSGPDPVALLAHGRLSGSNGLGGWKAVVYVCQRTGVRAIWQSPTLAGLTAVARDELITLRYGHPCEGAASSACAWTYEVYAFEPWPFESPKVSLISRTTR